MCERLTRNWPARLRGTDTSWEKYWCRHDCPHAYRVCIFDLVRKHENAPVGVGFGIVVVRGACLLRAGCLSQRRTASARTRYVGARDRGVALALLVVKQVLGTIWTTPASTWHAHPALAQSSLYPEFGNIIDLSVVSIPLERLLAPALLQRQDRGRADLNG